MNEITDAKFFAGGNAYFTVSAPDVRYTFRIRKVEKEQPFFVHLLKGPDNTTDYVYVGVYLPEQTGAMVLKLTRKSKLVENSRAVKAFRWAINTVMAKLTPPAGYKIQHEGRCCRCGRMLTVPESIEAGIGPECAGRMAA